jgi:hypothetical protein
MGEMSDSFQNVEVSEESWVYSKNTSNNFKDKSLKQIKLYWHNQNQHNSNAVLKYELFMKSGNSYSSVGLAKLKVLDSFSEVSLNTCLAVKCTNKCTCLVYRYCMYCTGRTRSEEY